MTGHYQCEQCGTDMETPAATQRVPGHRETIILRFCRDCSDGAR